LSPIGWIIGNCGGRRARVTPPPYYLSAAAIIRNEGPYIVEWIEYHRLIGVERFYLYDNESADNTRELLEPYIRKGVVVYQWYPGEKEEVAPGVTRQHLAYKDAVEKCKNETKWLAIIDIDEFIVPMQNETLTEFLKDFEGYSQLLIRWVIYGSSGHKTKPEGLVIENYQNRAPFSYVNYVKAIVNPRAVIRTKTHGCWVRGLTVDENKRPLDAERFIVTYAPPDFSITKIRVNHYQTKSLEEYLARGKAVDHTGDGKKVYKRTLEKWPNYDKNEVFDPVMEKFIGAVKKAMGLS